MDDGFKQRLVGAFVLLAVAVIVLPMMLDGANSEAIKVYAVMPDAPRIENTSHLLKDTKTPIQQLDKQIDQERQAEKKVADSEEPMKIAPAERKAGLTEAWALQVASFSQSGNASLLKQRLLDSGYNAYTRRFEDNDKTVYRVFIGPELQRSDLEKIQESVKNDPDFKLDGMIRIYKPV